MRAKAAGDHRASAGKVFCWRRLGGLGGACGLVGAFKFEQERLEYFECPARGTHPQQLGRLAGESPPALLGLLAAEDLGELLGSVGFHLVADLALGYGGHLWLLPFLRRAAEAFFAFRRAAATFAGLLDVPPFRPMAER
jgi:hypothetical protein